MIRPNDISPAIWERADILRDQLQHIADDTEYTARLIMALEAQQKDETFGLSKKQADVLAFIETFTEENGYSPSYTEICDGMGLNSRSKAHGLVHQLIERGAVRALPGRSRTLCVVGR